MKIDKISKSKLYARFGVKEYWLVDPEEKEITLLVLRKRGYRIFGIFEKETSFESPLLKGLTVSLKDVFA